MRLLTFQATVRILILIAVTLSVSPARGSSCNLVPNGRFEEGSATSADDWGFVATPSQGTFSVSAYPSELQSGERGVAISVSQPGSVYLTTIPEKTSIGVLGDTYYVVSARLLSFNGEKAGLWLIEWNNGNFVKGSFLKNGGGSGAWETLEATFRTQISTTDVSIRLSHHISSGTFYWDDVALWQQEAGRRCVDARHYVTQSTPGFQLCHSSSGVCIDGHKNAAGEFVVDLSHGNRNYYTHNGNGLEQDPRIGIHKNLDAGTWRCFADPGEQCGAADGSNAQFAPHTMPLTVMLPVLATNIDPNRVTQGADILHDWTGSDVRLLNPFDGSQPSLIGSNWFRLRAFIANSIDFGGSVGLRTNVLVFEEEQVGFDPAIITGNPNGGKRMERYYFVEGYCRVRQGGWEDSNCTETDPSECDGNYDTAASGQVTWNSTKPRDFTLDLDVPYGVVNWW